MDDFLLKFENDASELAKFAEIKVGFSGGADSTALLVALAAISRNLSFRLEVIHFEHGIRGAESEADAEWCRSFVSERLSAILAADLPPIEFRVIKLGLDPTSPNLEAAARDARMNHWQAIAGANTETAVALGHHADDRIENLFLRLLRGSNSTGLTSLRFSREIKGVHFVRPLISFRRTEIEDFLRSVGIEDWRVDKTNIDNRQTRNFIRNEILPLFNTKTPNTDKAFLRSITALERDAEHLEAEAESIYREARREIRGERPTALSTAKLAEASLASRPRILRLWLTEVLGCDAPPSSYLMDRVNAVLDSNLGDNSDERVGVKLISFDSAAFLKFDNDLIKLADRKKHEATAASNSHESIVWNWRETPEIEWSGHILNAKLVAAPEFSRCDNSAKIANNSESKVYFNAAEMPDELVVRGRQPGDKMNPFGSDSPVRLKKLLQGAALSSSEKEAIPIITLPNGEIIWAPLIRRSNFANLAHKPTTEALELSFEPSVNGHISVTLAAPGMPGFADSIPS